MIRPTLDGTEVLDPLNGKDQWFWHRIKWIRQICKEAGAGEDTLMEVDAIGTFALRTLSQMHLSSIPPGMEFPPRNDTPLSAGELAWQQGVVDDFNACMYREKCGDYRKLLWEAHRFLNAQAYTREEMDDFSKRLNTFLGIPNDE